MPSGRETKLLCHESERAGNGSAVKVHCDGKQKEQKENDATEPGVLSGVFHLRGHRNPTNFWTFFKRNFPQPLSQDPHGLEKRSLSRSPSANSRGEVLHRRQPTWSRAQRLCRRRNIRTCLPCLFLSLPLLQRQQWRPRPSLQAAKASSLARRKAKARSLHRRRAVPPAASRQQQLPAFASQIQDRPRAPSAVLLPKFFLKALPPPRVLQMRPSGFVSAALACLRRFPTQGSPPPRRLEGARRLASAFLPPPRHAPCRRSRPPRL